MNNNHGLLPALILNLIQLSGSLSFSFASFTPDLSCTFLKRFEYATVYAFFHVAVCTIARSCSMAPFEDAGREIMQHG